ncbi:DUF7379 domain-containing protein [Paludisphaera rhizosphaerae]|uniref:DUF7379 domain-containing protein n=1 Tax=Paludisphaera rhizosphaerae TaxID=2711216 RepID=UPI0013ECAFF6|nr:CHAT domain-containing protein [Paludisphaera rhizosphaerae]
MPTIHRKSGLQITTASGYRVAEIVTSAKPKRRTRSGAFPTAVPMPRNADAETAADDAVVEAFRRQEMELVDQVELEPDSSAPPAAKRGGRAARAAEATEFALSLEPHEDAVVLLEQDGVYSWEFATEATTRSAAGQKRGRAAAPAQRMVKFQITPALQAAPKRGETRRGIIGDFIAEKVRAFVFKFAARIAVGSAMAFLERNVRRGLVAMSDGDPSRWGLLDDPTSLLPKDRPARVLLFVHGTFSSTIGSYGALSATPWGQEFLKAARENYDLVIGFDHATLSNDPLENASDLLARLQSISWPHPPRLDVVTHSRGGLVLRSLSEHLLPLASFPVLIERVVFVAVTNGGTRLAEPANWHAMIDFYTNLSVAACRVIGMMPQAKAVTLVLGEIAQGLGSLVKYLATTIVTERAVPGLAAMEPDGDFIKKLNEEQVNQPSIANSYYCAITSEFEPRVFGGDHEPKEFPGRLLQWIIDVFAKQLIKEANDLVVDTASMTRVDPQLGKYIKDTLDFGKNPQVYHTNYFVRPEVANALARWLRLAGPAEIETRPRSTNTTRGGTRRPKGGKRGLPRAAAFSPDVIEVGGVAGAEIPAAVDTDIVVMAATTPVEEALESIKQDSPSYVVIRREHQGEMLNYAFSSEEVLEQAKIIEGQTSLHSALNLHETGRSDTRSVTDSMIPAASKGFESTTRRAVVLSGYKPVGVLPEESELSNAEELANLARLAVNPTKDADKVLARRAMPTFAIAHGTAPDPTPRPANRGGGGTTRSGDGASRGGGGATRGPGKKTAVEPKVTCHFRAEMEEEVVLNRTTTVEVLVSREVIGKAIHAAASESQVEIDPSRKLLIQVLPKVNFESVDEDWVEIDPPKPGEPTPLYFILRPTHVGEGEVRVVARQGQVPLVTLVLKPQIVKTRGKSPRRASASATTAEAPKLAAPLHQLTIIERRNGDDVSYSYRLQSPALKVLERGDSKPLVGDRKRYVEELYKTIEDRWVSTDGDQDDFLEELRAIGAVMFNELIPDKLQRVLWDYRDQLKSIMVMAEEPFIPWELVHLCAPGKPLGSEERFLGQLGLVRWLDDAGWPNEKVGDHAGKARYVIPSYPHPDYVLPEAEKEWKFLEDEFKATRVEAKSGAVRKLLAQPGAFDLLHFACHGVADQGNISDAQLLMEGRVEGGKYVLDKLTATTVESHANLGSDGRAPIVVLNACQAGRAGYKLTGVGGFAQAFLRRGAGAFVGTLWSVGDSPARTFTESFYTHLKQGAMISEAAVAAREEARKAGDATWLAYVVYGHPHAKLG